MLRDSVFLQHQQMEDIRIILGDKTFLQQQKFHSISKFVLSILSSILRQGYFDNCSINPIKCPWGTACRKRMALFRAYTVVP